MPFCYFNSIKVQLELWQKIYFIFVFVFQFHKGTIRTCLTLSKVMTQLSNFNSIKVQLERASSAALMLATSYFNSIKVQLEQFCWTCICSTISFQFHKGTIRTLSAELARLCRYLFQFHKGTIRTINRLLNTIGVTYFNSIKVQLEPWSSCFLCWTCRISIP